MFERVGAKKLKRGWRCLCVPTVLCTSSMLLRLSMSYSRNEQCVPAMYKFNDWDWSRYAPRSRAMSINVCNAKKEVNQNGFYWTTRNVAKIVSNVQTFILISHTVLYKSFKWSGMLGMA